MQVTRWSDGTCVVLGVQGDVDLATADTLFDEGRRVLTPGTTLVLDLADVAFLDSSGIGALIELRNLALDTGGELRLRRPTARTLRLLEITALDTVFTID